MDKYGERKMNKDTWDALDAWLAAPPTQNDNYRR